MYSFFYHDINVVLKGLTRYELKLFKIYFFNFKCLEWSIQIFLTLQKKFKNQILSNKRVTKVRTLCFVNKVRVMLLYTCVLHWPKFQSNVAFCC